MSFDTDQIAHIAHDACTMFGLDLIGADGAQTGAMELVASIEIEGDWSGVVAMGCSAAFAQRLASAIFEMDAADLSADEVADAFGELVNVAAGNIKALLPAGCRMGIPVVEPGAELDTSSPAKAQLWGFESHGDPLAVVVRPYKIAA